MAAIKTPDWFPRSTHGHVIAEVKFGRDRFLRCSCGYVIRNEPDNEEQGRAFGLHRRTSPPEKVVRSAAKLTS